nr:retinoblastoma-related protein [Quercus suber]
MNGLVSILIVLMCGSVKKDSKGVDILTSLCNKYETSEDELRKTMEKANNSFIYILNKKPQPPSECRIGNLENIDTGILEKDYDGAIRSKGELDERVFINDEDSILGSESLSGGSVNISGVKRKFDLIASLPKAITSPLSPQHSPASHANGSIGGSNSKMVAMPVSTAMTTAKWDLTEEVDTRALIILFAIFPSTARGEHRMSTSLQSANLMDSIWAEQRKFEALKLYYRVLKAICRAEAQILHASNLTALLPNERFRRLLERTGITAFDLSKVIESFIRPEESRLREWRRHLNSLEELD